MCDDKQSTLAEFTDGVDADARLAELVRERVAEDLDADPAALDGWTPEKVVEALEAVVSTRALVDAEESDHGDEGDVYTDRGCRPEWGIH